MSPLATVVVFALVAGVFTATTLMPVQKPAPTEASRPAPTPAPKPAPTAAPTPKPTPSPSALYNASVDAAHAALADLVSEAKKLSSRLNDDAASTAAGAEALRAETNSDHALQLAERQDRDNVKALVSDVSEKCSVMDKLAPTKDQGQKPKSIQDYYREKYDPTYLSGPSKAITSRARALQHDAERSIGQYYRKVKGELNEASRAAKRAREKKEQDEENKQILRVYSQQAKARVVSTAQVAATEAQVAAEAAAQQQAADHAVVKKQSEEQAAAKRASAQAKQRAASESKVAQQASAKASTANSSTAAQEQALASNARAASRQALEDQLSSQVAEAQAAQAAAQARLAILADAKDAGAKREAEAAAEKRLDAAKALDLLPDAASASARTRGGAALAGQIKVTAEPLNAPRAGAFIVAAIALVSLTAGLRAFLCRTAPQIANFPNLG